jgi:glucan 1,3-beta-glucosidase
MDKIKGVNIGGWLVLEPWITPSLFYPFLGKHTNNNNNNKIGMDMYTFCEVLGPLQANKILRNHWSTWVTEEHIQIFSKNNINLLRVPIGDWMYIPYGPFSTTEQNTNKNTNKITKCTDGAIEALDNLFILGKKYNMRILLDLHGVKGSQNGFDNSGQTLEIEIQNNNNNNNTIHFKHWEIRKANWIGPFDIDSKSYPIIDEENIRHSKTVLLHIIKKYYNYPMLYGLCVLNEPWEFTPEIFLKGFYQDIFNMFTEYMSSDKVFVIHDSFRSNIWENFELEENTKNIKRQDRK